MSDIIQSNPAPIGVSSQDRPCDSHHLSHVTDTASRCHFCHQLNEVPCQRLPFQEAGGRKALSASRFLPALAINTDVCLQHDGPRGHPETSERLISIIERVKLRGYCHKFYWVESRPATLSEISLVHGLDYWDTMTRLSRRSATLPQSRANELPNTVTGTEPVSSAKVPSPTSACLSFGGDLYYCPQTDAAAAMAAGTTLNLIDAIMNHEVPVQNGFALVRPPGHHANASRAQGFCYLNNIAMAAKHLKVNHGLSRILIVDFDVHHGHGTQELLCRDPSFLYFSVHRYDNGKCYPCTGCHTNKGKAAGKGYSVNVPLVKGYGDSDLYVVFRDILFPLAEAFDPEFVLISAGFDAAAGDPIGGCTVTPAGFAWVTRQLLRLARHYASGRAAFVLEGGYSADVLAECVDTCLESLTTFASISFTVLHPTRPTADPHTFFIERYPAIEDVPQVLEKFITTSVSNDQTGAEDYVTTLKKFHAAADPLYDFLSQWLLEPRARAWQTAFPAYPPPFPCTFKILASVQLEHSGRPFYLPPLFPWSLKVARERLTKLQYQPASTQLISPPVPIQSIDLKLTKSSQDLDAIFKAFFSLRSFDTVGGHANQWHIGPHTLLGYVVKSTLHNEALFYAWLGQAYPLQPEAPCVRGASWAPAADGHAATVARFCGALPSMSKKSAAVIKSLLPFIPHCASVELPPLEHFDSRLFLVELENLLKTLHQPCIMDLKIGLRMYGDDASEEKRLRMIRKAENSTAAHHGVRLTAYKSWDPQKKIIRHASRTDANAIKTLEALTDAVSAFMGGLEKPQHRTCVLHQFLYRLRQLKAWFSTQTILHFYSSSLLFLYDSAPLYPITPDIRDAACPCGNQEQHHPRADLRMIDFAHVTFHPNCCDTGYLKGLETLIQLFERLLQGVSNDGC